MAKEILKNCEYCGKEYIAADNYPHIDHIIPLARGGTDTRNNVRVLCRRCNMLKGVHLDGEWEHLIPLGGGKKVSTAIS